MKGRRGFTLIEVMVAVVIVVMSAIMLGTAYINVLQGYENAKRATGTNTEVAFAREILFHIADLDQAEEGGDFQTVEGGTVDWRATIEPTEVADLFTVILEVQLPPDDQGERETVEEQFRLLRPTWSEDADRDQLRQEARARIEDYTQEREGQR